MGAAIAAVIPLLPMLIRTVEMLFGNKPKSGADKLDAVSQAARAVLEKMLAAGVIPGEARPTDPELRGAVEAVFQDLRARGQLDAPVAADGPLYLVRGQVWPLKGNL